MFLDLGLETCEEFHLCAIECLGIEYEILSVREKRTNVMWSFTCGGRYMNVCKR
jgi:hypothetical protein